MVASGETQHQESEACGRSGSKSCQEPGAPGLSCPSVPLTAGQEAPAGGDPHWGGHEAGGTTLWKQRLLKDWPGFPQPFLNGIPKPLTSALSQQAPPCVRGVHSRYDDQTEGEKENLENGEKWRVLGCSPVPATREKGSLLPPPSLPRHRCWYCSFCLISEPPWPEVSSAGPEGTWKKKGDSEQPLAWHPR